MLIRGFTATTTTKIFTTTKAMLFNLFLAWVTTTKFRTTVIT